MRAIVTGQIGLDKKAYLDAVARLAGERGEPIAVFHVGDRMYAEAPDVRPGRILDLPLGRLNALRRAVFKDILAQAGDHKNVIVNTHATFRWRHGLFAAFDFDQIRQFNPDVAICLVDNIEVAHQRLHSEHTSDATLKDLMVWREEEIMATELLAKVIDKPAAHNFAILARGRHQPTHETCFRLVCRPHMRRVYPSFPMSHVLHMPQVLAEIDDFRAQIARHFIAFDPGDVDEKILLDRAIAAARDGKDFLEMDAGSFAGKPVSFPVSVKQILDIAGDIDGQIYARDFKLIDQSDMIVSFIPQLQNGIPGLSSGVERELHHAFEHGKEVYIIWKPDKPPSPFITETATQVFSSTQQAMRHFEDKGYIMPVGLFGH